MAKLRGLSFKATVNLHASDDSKWSSLRLSDVDIDESTITKIVAKINQINLECESTHQFNENERRL
eukprot:85360-Pleurochrysis_carterae.AAC.1